MNKEAVDKFLIELSKLSNEHGIQISGCGCCGSPFLIECEKGGIYTVDNNNEILEYETKTPH